MQKKYFTLVTEALNLTLNYSVCSDKCGDENNPLPIEVTAGFRPLSTYTLPTYDNTMPLNGLFLVPNLL
jgi:hypothetical protein